MTAVPLFHGCFTLLYADPEVREEGQYLQPLYGLTAEDDPQSPHHRHESSQDGSLDSSANSSLTAADAMHDVADLRRLSVPGEPAVRSHKHPRVSSGLVPAPTTGQSPNAEVDGSSRSGAAAASGPVARPPRAVQHSKLCLYPELTAGVAGPQPVFGGAALAPDAQSASFPSSMPYLFNSSGAPLLSSIVDDAALQQLRAARRPYPTPASRSGHVLLPCPSRGSLILYGGLGDDPFNDVWEYDTNSGRWTRLHCVPAEQEQEEERSAAQVPRGEAGSADVANAAAETHRLGAPGTASTAARSNEPAGGTAVRRWRLQGQSSDEESAVSTDTGEDDDDDDDDDNNGDDAAADGGSEGQASHPNPNMPPPAYGQAAALYVDERGDTCMAVLGGITLGDVCVHGFFALNLTTLTWRRVETSLRMKDMWGATAQTLHAPRRYPRFPPASNTAAAEHDEEEEQVVVVFGGMTAMGEVIEPTTHVLHLDHRLTAEEVAANATFFLDNMQYTKMEHTRVLRRVMREEEKTAKEAGGIPMDDSQSLSIVVRCERWRVQHAEQLERWRARALRNLVGTYWTETVSASSSLHGRRRPTSAAFSRHFMYIFGGRDDLYFYNDLWCLNIVTRTWVQVRDGIPPHLLRRFLDQPHNPVFGMQLNERAAQLRRRTVAAVEAKLEQNSSGTPSSAISSMLRNREVHHALFSSSVNSTARARTGACMVVDTRRECLYVYGGFAYTGQQHLTFFDLHAYYIRENVWRRVAICHSRPWDVALDGEQEAVTLVEPTEEARPYARHARPCVPFPRDEQQANEAEEEENGRQSLRTAAASSRLPPTLMAHAAQYLRPRSSATAASPPPAISASSPSHRDDEEAPPPPIVRRGCRGGVCRRGDAAVDGSTAFRLPAMVPEARTMAAMAEDPRCPGARFFLHGGRSGEEACGDFFELRTAALRTVDVEYGKTQRAARLEAQRVATSHGSSSPAAAAAAADSAQASPPSIVAAAASAASTPATAPPSAAAAAAAGSPADTNRLHLRSRRQLQRQLISAALATHEACEDAPAPLVLPTTPDAPPRPSLRDKAVRWVRNGLSAADAKSLMFVELRNGRAVVNLRTHIHYSSRLSLLAGSEAAAEDSVASRTSAGTTAAAFSTRASPAAPASATAARRGAPSSSLSSSSLPAAGGAAVALSPAEAQQQMESLEGHLKRSALSLEVLLYDVLLSKPTCHASSNSGDGIGMTSPCTYSVPTATSPESHHAFPAFPLSGSSPSTSPSGGTSLPTAPAMVQIISRAQYTTPRTPQPSDVAGSRAREHRTPSPALTRRSSSFCSSNGTGFQPPQSTNNEYDYHILLRSLFHRELFYRSFGSSEKKK